MQYANNLHQHFRINVAGLSDIGKVRDENEDYFTSYSNKDWPFAYLVVADGMGGYAGGAIASKIATETVASHLNSLPIQSFINLPQSLQIDSIYLAVEESIKLANKAVLDEKNINPHLAQMGTTVVLAVIWQDQLIVANVGDSRAYLWQSSQLTLHSRDHSLVQELIDSGSITLEQARQHKNRNQLTQAVGINGEIKAEIRRLQLHEDSLLLLCTDGLTEYLDEQSISSELECQRPLLEHCYRMIETANHEGGKDNITIACAAFSRWLT